MTPGMVNKDHLADQGTEKTCRFLLEFSTNGSSKEQRGSYGL
jgi:hypothetical protein